MARSPRRIAAALLLAGATALSVGACSPVTTMHPYNPSDGVRAELGSQVNAENITILTEAKGEPGTVLGALTNRTNELAKVTLTVDGVDTPLNVRIPANDTVLLGPDHNKLILPEVPTEPGAVVSVDLSTSQSGSVNLEVPVLDGTLPEYSKFVPVTVSKPAEQSEASDSSATDNDQSDSDDSSSQSEDTNNN